MSIHRILGGLYLSSLEPLQANEDIFKLHNITHIISVISGDEVIPPQYTTSPYTHLQVPINDSADANIIQYFPDCNDFIDSAKTAEAPGNVLVHCAQGVSRSVTIVLAYLMYKHKLSVNQAIYAVRRKKADIGPNHGFIIQLKLYESMDNVVVERSSIYVDFLTETNARVNPEALRDQYLQKGITEQSVKVFHEDLKPFGLRCKKCRQHLSTSAEITQHTPPTSESREAQFIRTAPKSRRIVSSETGSTNCLHFFYTEPLSWMTSELEKGEIEGKFACGKCQAKIGGYSWKGSRCSCGKWMVPAIHLQSAKVDKLFVQAITE